MTRTKRFSTSALPWWPFGAGFVILGNVGLPVPEESILVLSGYLAWRGDLKLPLVIAVGVIAAAAGDIIGFWIGRKYGHAALDRYRHSMPVKPERLESVTRFLDRYGAFAVFAARFIPGLRVRRVMRTVRP
jgi:membrane protein DedA with SNARE-associated domain